MRAFHLSWLAFFVCFFGWFGVAPLMPVVRRELQLTTEQIGNTIIASVAATVLARPAIGWLCDRIGPRRAYTGLLVLGSIPVMGIGLADSYESFLVARLCIGVIGASFVITQYHTSVMFAPNVVGAANATTAGWGNVGGGATQVLMPLVLAGITGLGVHAGLGWRLAMVVPGVLLLVTGALYYLFTQDDPDGNLEDRARPRGADPSRRPRSGGFVAAAADPRVWALFAIYGACFGVELTVHNVAALYFHDHFDLDLGTAGLIAGLFGTMNLFARTLGGALSDAAGSRGGLRGRVALLGLLLVAAATALIVFSRLETLWLVVPVLMVFGLLVQASSGATFSVVPMVNRSALGSVAGIVGAGGNAGAVAAGFLFRTEGLGHDTAFLYLGIAMLLASVLVLAVRFSPAQERAAAEELRESSALRAVASSPGRRVTW